MSSTSTSNLLEFMIMIGKLKSTKRTGWVLRNVTEPESIACHMYRMAVMAFLIDSKSGLDKDKCIKMALVHDMAECIVGDLTPQDNVPKEDKHKMEKEAMEELSSHVSKETSSELLSLWQEYEDESTPEAKFVKDLDKFDMILQAYEYEKQEEKPQFLQEFFNSTQGKFRSTQVKEWVKELETERSKHVLSETSVNSSPPSKKLKTDSCESDNIDSKIK